MAKEAADLVLLDRSLGVVLDGIHEGRRTVENVTKYILMGASSNLGNMVSMAGAALFLPFLPMLPMQVLLNNLLYDLSEAGVPFDNVDPETVKRPMRWDLGLIKRFMLVLGPLSSLFDFSLFWALLTLFNANEAIFQNRLVRGVARNADPRGSRYPNSSSSMEQSAPWTACWSLHWSRRGRYGPALDTVWRTVRSQGTAGPVLPAARRHFGCLPGLRGIHEAGLVQKRHPGKRAAGSIR